MADAAVDTGTETNVFEQELAGQGQPSETTAQPSGSPPGEVGVGVDPVVPTATPQAQPSQPQGQQGPVDLVALLEKQLQEEMGGVKPAPKANPEQELQKLLQGVQPGTPAHERIRALANARTEATAQVAEVQAQLQQVQQYIPQVQQWAQNTVAQVTAQKDQQIQALTSQLQALSSNFEAMKSLAPKPPVDPADELKTRWEKGVQDLIQEREQSWEKERLAPIQQKIEAFEKWQADQRLQTEALNVRTVARNAAESIVMRGLEFSDPAQKEMVSKGLAAEIIAHQMHTGSTSEQAAMAVRQKHMMTAAAFTRAATKGFAAAKKVAGEAPTATTTRRNAGLGAPMPSLAEIHKLGYADELEFMAAQDRAQGL